MAEHAADEYEFIAKRVAELRRQREAELARVGADPDVKPTAHENDCYYG